MRIHAAACGYVLFFAFRMGIHRAEWACLLLAMGLVLGMETLNTAVEKLCDHVCHRRDPGIGKVKDLAAGAVVLSALFAAAVGAVVLVRPELIEVLKEVAGTPYVAGGLAAYTVGCVILIFFVPLRRE